MQPLLPEPEPEDQAAPRIMQNWPSFSGRGLLDPSETPRSSHPGTDDPALPSTVEGLQPSQSLELLL